MQPDDRIRLQHMVDAGREAIGFASGQTRTDLDSNRMLLLSLVKSVEFWGRQQIRFLTNFVTNIPISHGEKW